MLVARIASRPQMPSSAAEQLALRLELLDDRLDHELGRGQRAEVGGGGQAPARGLGRAPTPSAPSRRASRGPPRSARCRRRRTAARRRARPPRARPPGRPARCPLPSCRAPPHRPFRSPRRRLPFRFAADRTRGAEQEIGNPRDTLAPWLAFATDCAWADATNSDAVVYEYEAGTEIIVLDAVEEVADAVEPGVLAAAEPLPGPTRRALRRQRQELLRVYRAQVTDLGGLVVEMARRGVHNARAGRAARRRRSRARAPHRRARRADRRRPRRSAAATSPCRALPPAARGDGGGRPPRPARAATRCSRHDANFCAYCGATRERGDGRRHVRGAGSRPRCPACLADGRARPAVLPGVRRAARRPVRRRSSPPRGRARRPPRSSSRSALLLLLGGFGIAYGFTRDDDGTNHRSPPTTAHQSTGGVAVPPTGLDTAGRCRPSRACPARPT